MADALAKGKKPSSAKPRSGDDAFVEGTFRLWTWIQKNLQTVVIGSVAIAIVVAGFLYYVNFQASVRNQALTELAALRLSAGDPATLTADLEAYVDRFEGTEAADEARLLLARQYLDSDRAAEAMRVASAVSVPGDEPVGFAARRLLAIAQQESGDLEAALATYQSLAGAARFPFQRRQVRASAAHILVELGRLDEAATIYSALADEAEEEDPVEAGVYRIRLGEIEGLQRQG